MKKITVIYFFVTLYLIFVSYSAGPGSQGWECTGAETGLGNPAGCKGSGCHSTTATTTVGIAIELDSVGVPTTHYVGGRLYTVKLTGTNNSTTTFPKYGFQMGSIQGSVAVTTPTNAGTWTSPYPASTHHSAPQANNFVVSVVEHSAAITPTTGSGGQGSTYVRTFTWTAPIAGTGTISIWAAINLVNGNGNADTGDKWNTNHAIINEWPSTTGISTIDQNQSDFSIFPNPASDKTTIHYALSSNFTSGEIRVNDVSGKTIAIVPVLNTSTSTNLDCNDFANGIYFVSLIVNNEMIKTAKIIVAK